MFMGVRGVWAALWCVLVLAARVDATARGSLAPMTYRRLADESAKATGGDAKGSWNEWRYRSNEELASAMDALHAGPCAGISKLTTIGTSVRGVEMRAMEVSTQPGVEQTKPGIMLVGNMHGDEPVGRELILRFARLLCIAHERRGRSAGGDEPGGGGLEKDPSDEASAKDLSDEASAKDLLDEASAKLLDEAAVVARNARVFLVPTMNPDGFSARRRNNANSVDLNRDFPDQFNEPGMPDRFDARQPETAAMMRFSESVNATAALNFHEGALVANYPYDAISGTNRKAGYSKSPDDAAFRRLAKVYARAHPTMATAANEEFPEGITNGARWYPLWGGMQDWHYVKTQTMDVTVEVNERKWPDESQLARLWTEHAPAMMAYAKTVATESTFGRLTDSVTGEAIRGATLAVAGVDVRFRFHVATHGVLREVPRAGEARGDRVRAGVLPADEDGERRRAAGHLAPKDGRRETILGAGEGRGRRGGGGGEGRERRCDGGGEGRGRAARAETEAGIGGFGRRGSSAPGSSSGPGSSRRLSRRPSRGWRGGGAGGRGRDSPRFARGRSSPASGSTVDDRGGIDGEERLTLSNYFRLKVSTLERIKGLIAAHRWRARRTTRPAFAPAASPARSAGAASRRRRTRNLSATRSPRRLARDPGAPTAPYT